MFTAEMIRDRVCERPFVPFRVMTSAGEGFDGYHPELVFVGIRDIMIGTASRKGPTIYCDVARVALMHIESLNDLAAPATAGSAEQ
jgi:hypothetical protein